MRRQIPITQKARGFEFSNDTRCEVVAESPLQETDELFTWNPTGIPKFHHAELHLTLRNRSANNCNVTLQIDGTTTADYDYITESGTTATETLGDPSFTLATISPGWNISGSYALPLSMFREADTRPSVERIGIGGNYNTAKLRHGHVNNANTTAITSINLETDQNVHGKAVLLGWKL